MLVGIDGDPTYEGVSGTELQRIINTSAFIVCDEAGMHYLKLGDTWMEADGLTGSWSVAGMPPEGADVALASALTHGHINLFTSPADSRVPVVFIATTPAELIVTDGDPEYAPFNGTSLLYVKNTSAVVFKEPTD